MDTITHGIVGALIGKAFFAGRGDATRADGTAARDAAGQFGGLGSPRWNRGECVATAAATLGAVFPDVDVIFGPIVRNDLAVIELHRSITHSLLSLPVFAVRSEEHTSELQSLAYLVCRLLLEKKKHT